jgi:hypothetical protein
VKNMLYRRTDEVKKLQKVIGDTERQFVDYLQQVKALGEKDEQMRKELEDLRGAAQELVDMVDPPKEGEAGPRPLLERLRSPEENAQVPIRSSSRLREQRPRICKVLRAECAARHFCAGDGGGLLGRAF